MAGTNRLGDLVSGARTLLGVISGRKVFGGPRSIALILSSTCNSACVMCWFHSQSVREMWNSPRYAFNLVRALGALDGGDELLVLTNRELPNSRFDLAELEGLPRCARLSWRATAEATLDVYRRAAGEL